MGTKMAVAFANIFMASVETEITSLIKTKPLEWKRYIDDCADKKEIACVQPPTLLKRNRRRVGGCTQSKKEIEDFIILANRHHLTIKFTAEISNKEVNFLDTTV